MAYCGERGIPHSVFLGWEPTDRAKALAWMLREGRRCSGCGTFPDEWVDDDRRVVDPVPYVAETVTCEGCRELDQGREDHKERLERGGDAVRLTLVANPVLHHPTGGDVVVGD